MRIRKIRIQCGEKKIKFLIIIAILGVLFVQIFRLELVIDFESAALRSQSIKADVSTSIAGAADLAQVSSDSIILNGKIEAITAAKCISDKTMP